jgi:hypothetical protein
MIRRTDRIGWIRTFVIILIVTIGILVIQATAAPVPLKATIVVQPAATIVQQQTVSSVATAVIADDIAPYKGPVGPSNALYGLKLSLENFDESFAPSPSVRIEKQLDHANLRIAEAKAELLNNRLPEAEVALEQYREKMTETTAATSSLAVQETGLLHAQEMVATHQYVLEQLLMTHQGNPGLVSAYTNSVKLETTFIEKTNQKLERTVMPDNRLLVQVVRIEPAMTAENHTAATSTSPPSGNSNTNTTPPYDKTPPTLSPMVTPAPHGTSVSTGTHDHSATVSAQPTPVKTPQPTPTVSPVVTVTVLHLTVSPTPTPSPAKPTESPTQAPQNNQGNTGKPATGTGNTGG